MTTLMVILGLAALVAGLVFRSRVTPTLHWVWHSAVLAVLFMGAFIVAISMVILMVVVVLLFIAFVVLFCVLVVLGIVGFVLYLPVLIYGLGHWAVTRKRDLFDSLSKRCSDAFYLSGSLLDIGYDAMNNMFDRLDYVFDLFDKLADYGSPHWSHFSAPIVRASKKIWPRD